MPRARLSLLISQDETQVEYRLIVANIDNVTASHIHLCAAGVNGPVIAFLAGDLLLPVEPCRESWLKEPLQRRTWWAHWPDDAFLGEETAVGLKPEIRVKSLPKTTDRLTK